MKKTVYSKIITLIAVLSILLTAVPAFASAIDSSEMTITIRIEGISSNLYNEQLPIPYTETLSVKDALAYLDTKAESLNITLGSSTHGAYISDIKGEAAATFGGYDGWLYRVNNVEPSVGIDGYNLADGDSLLVYYGDPFGEGLQFPLVDSSKIDEGILKFTSKDTTYDENWNPIEAINPITNAVVTWYYNDTSVTYKTDANGEVVIPTDKLTLGSHKIQIEKYSQTTADGKFLPLVLRLSANTSVEVIETLVPTNEPTITGTESSSDDSNISQTGVKNDNAPTGDSANGLFVMIFLASLSILAIAIVVIKSEKA